MRAMSQKQTMKTSQRGGLARGSYINSAGDFNLLPAFVPLYDKKKELSSWKQLSLRSTWLLVRGYI